VGLGIVRSLGAHGIPTWVFDTEGSKSIAQFSRYTKRFVESKEEVSELLLHEGRKNNLNGWVVFPVTDEYVEALATHHESLSSFYRLTTPPLEITKFALDKRLTYCNAHKLGIATPWSSPGNCLDHLEQAEIPYPVILKPAINHHFFPQTNLKVLPVADPQDLERCLAQMSRYIPLEEILVQERIPGAGESQFSYCAVCRDGRVFASLVANVAGSIRSILVTPALLWKQSTNPSSKMRDADSSRASTAMEWLRSSSNSIPGTGNTKFLTSIFARGAGIR
jgi:D-aspartate ligase